MPNLERCGYCGVGMHPGKPRLRKGRYCTPMCASYANTRKQRGHFEKKPYCRLCKKQVPAGQHFCTKTCELGYQVAAQLGASKVRPA